MPQGSKNRKTDGSPSVFAVLLFFCGRAVQPSQPGCLHEPFVLQGLRRSSPRFGLQPLCIDRVSWFSICCFHLLDGTGFLLFHVFYKKITESANPVIFLSQYAVGLQQFHLLRRLMTVIAQAQHRDVVVLRGISGEGVDAA